jgi:hypothetical protein
LLSDRLRIATSACDVASSGSGSCGFGFGDRRAHGETHLGDAVALRLRERRRRPARQQLDRRIRVVEVLEHEAADVQVVDQRDRRVDAVLPLQLAAEPVVVQVLGLVGDVAVAVQVLHELDLVELPDEQPLLDARAAFPAATSRWPCRPGRTSPYAARARGGR